MKIQTILLVLMLCFLSCRPMRDLSFEILYPASVKIPDKDASYLILNCSYLPEYVEDPSNMIALLPPRDINYIDSLIINHLFDGLFSILIESPYPGLREAGYLEMRTSDTTGFLRSLSPETVSDICREQNADFIISLEYYSYNQLAGYYYVIEEGNYQDLTEQKQKLFWRIYAREGQLIEEYIQRDTFYMEDVGDDYQSGGRISLNSENIREGFQDAGIQYARRISPFWENANRIIYDLHQKTDSGYIDISEDKIKLKSLSFSNRKTKSYKACYNLAVVLETEGEIIDALKWIELALKLNNNKMARQYSTILETRLEDIDKLDGQTGTNK